jgi:molybdopterin converting factor small subunit
VFGSSSIREQPNDGTAERSNALESVVPQATFWFSSPFREWIGQRSLTLTWEGRITLREIWERLAADHPELRANLPREGIQEEAMSHLTAVIVDGDILTLDAEIKDGAKVDVLTPLSGGNPPQPCLLPHGYLTSPKGYPVPGGGRRGG